MLNIYSINYSSYVAVVLFKIKIENDYKKFAIYELNQNSRWTLVYLFIYI